MNLKTLWHYASAHLTRLVATTKRTTATGNSMNNLKPNMPGSSRQEKCKRCGHKLTDPRSIKRVYGPTCYKKEMEKKELKLWNL